MTLADRIVLLRAGVIEQMGSPAELYNKPENMFVASFLGNPPMNFIKANIENGNLSCAGQSLGKLSDYPVSQNYNGSSIIIGIRPEKVAEGTAGPKTLSGKLDLVEMLGANTLLHSQVSEDVKLIGFSKKYDLATNSTVSLSFDPKDCHFFDPTNEQRV
jgi:multiple sugar transport system ATP-binding protein